MANSAIGCVLTAGQRLLKNEPDHRPLHLGRSDRICGLLVYPVGRRVLPLMCACPICGSQDRPHFCEERPPMVVIDSNKLKKFWTWLKGKFKLKETK